MYLITRTSTVPASPLVIGIDQPQGDGDGGFHQGGMFYFQPAGEDGDRHQVTEYAAKAIMGDPSLAQHFSCDPALPADEPVAQAADEQPDGTTAARRVARKRSKD